MVAFSLTKVFGASDCRFHTYLYQYYPLGFDCELSQLLESTQNVSWSWSAQLLPRLPWPLIPPSLSHLNQLNFYLILIQPLSSHCINPTKMYLGPCIPSWIYCLPSSLVLVSWYHNLAGSQAPLPVSLFSPNFLPNTYLSIISLSIFRKWLDKEKPCSLG